MAAKNAEQAVNDVAAGVKQGWTTKPRPPAPAARPEFRLGGRSASLPGISVVKARQIIDHRPYTSSHDLVKSGVLTERQFDEIAPKVTVR